MRERESFTSGPPQEMDDGTGYKSSDSIHSDGDSPSGCSFSFKEGLENGQMH